MEKEKLLVSACLLGLACRYDGQGKGVDLGNLAEKYEIVPFCPEIYGGLPTPREGAEIVGERVLTKSGRDVTREYERGANEALKPVRALGIKKALMKEKSPSCGTGRVYDGTFSRTLRPGLGVTAELLSKNGVELFGESEIERLLGDET